MRKIQYTIKKGDNLWSIAKANNTTVDAIAKANNITNPSLIYAGNTIEIPSAVNNATPQTVQTSVAAPTVQTAKAQKPVYTESADVKNAYSALVEKEKQAPPSYSSKYEEAISALVENILSREDFTYDYSKDPMYRAYRDSYETLGRLAMEDTVGVASALTGGYSNSYAVTAGSQAYQKYLTELTGKIPSLMQAALARYDREGERMESELSMLRDLESGEYGRWRDSVEDYRDERDYLADRYDTLSKADYDKYLDLLDAYERELDREAEAARLAEEAAYKAERDRIKDAQWEREYALAAAKAAYSSASSTKSSANKTSGSSSITSIVSYSQLGERARYLADLLSSPKAFLRDGFVKPGIKNTYKNALNDKEITYMEYYYLLSLIEKVENGEGIV